MITAELFNYELIASITKFDIKKFMWIQNIEDIFYQFESRRKPLMSRNAGKYCLTGTSYLTELFVVFILLHVWQSFVCFWELS